MKTQLDADVTREGDRGVAPEHVAFASIQFGETGFTGRGNGFDLAGVAQYSSCRRTTEVDVKTTPNTVSVRLGKARDAGAHHAAENAPISHIFQGARLRSAGHAEYQRGSRQNSSRLLSHYISSLTR